MVLTVSGSVALTFRVSLALPFSDSWTDTVWLYYLGLCRLHSQG